MSDYYFNALNKSTNVRVDRIGSKITHFLLRFLWRWAPGFTRWLSMCLFFSPPAYRASAEEEDGLRQGHAFQIRVNEKILHAWRWGQGPVILLVHGWGGRGIQFHRFVAPLVKAGYTAVALDMPAHGVSTGRITSYFEFTDTLRFLLSKERGLNVQGIIAHSFGASATINALVKEEIAPVTVCLAPILRLRELLLTTFERFGLPQEIYSTLIRQFEKRFGYNLKADNPLHLLGDLCGPVFWVHDENDRTVAFSDSADHVRNHAKITMYATRGLGHRRILTDQTVVQACLDHIGQPQAEHHQPLTASQEIKNGIH